MAIDVDKLKDNVMEDIASNLGLDTGEEESSKRIAKLSFMQAWKAYCIWNGLLGSFYISLAEAYENLKQAEIKEAKQ
jgi:hypothetical protein